MLSVVSKVCGLYVLYGTVVSASHEEQVQTSVEKGGSQVHACCPTSCRFSTDSLNKIAYLHGACLSATQCLHLQCVYCLWAHQVRFI